MKKIFIIFVIFLNFSFSNCNYCESLEEILKHKSVLNFLHLEEKNRNILYLEKNEYCTLNKNIFYNLKIITLEKESLLNQKNLLIIKDIKNIDKNEYKMILYYPIEGVYFEAIFKNSKLFNIETIEN